MLSTRFLLLIAFSGLLSTGAFCQNGPETASVPSDPLELVTGPIQEVDTPENRLAVFRLLGHARDNYELQSADRGYKLKVSFTVHSGGQTQYDGAWEIEDTFAPGLGLRWTAKAAAGYATTRLDSNGLHYGEGTESIIPLALHEARGALLGAMETPAALSRQRIRTSAATLNGLQLTCVLLSSSDHVPASGRGWEETEECIDSQSGLLRVHSLVPGRYAVYEYANELDFHSHILPRTVTITEAGEPVIRLRVDSLEELPAPDPAMFAPTEEMRWQGP
jgi:hypothetical protein